MAEMNLFIVKTLVGQDGELIDHCRRADLQVLPNVV